jgi:hypothetical protein
MVTPIGASGALVQIDVTTQQDPQIERHCAGCKARGTFASSGKFRVNANGKQVDAWLIYRCVLCRQSWNYPIHARRPVRSFDAAELTALMRNDAILAARHARDVAGLTAAGAEVMPGCAVEISRTILRPAGDDAARVQLILRVAPACEIRLDRLLALVLELPRSEIERLAGAAGVTIVTGRKDAADAPRALRRTAGDGQRIEIDPARCPPSVLQALRAAGAC